MTLKIALIGNPNCGKTTMYNALTGSTQYVGNWPGVTVEKKEGVIKDMKNALLVDLPGIYSLSPYTLEERITRDYLTDDKPDAIINIVDSTNIERSLYLTTQLTELNLPVVLALNMTDVVEKAGDIIDAEKLSAELDCPVVKTSAAEGMGLKELLKKTVDFASAYEAKKSPVTFCGSVEKALLKIEAIASKAACGHSLRWTAVNLFSRDPVLREHLPLDTMTLFEIDKVICECEKELDDDSESIIANERYGAIDKVVKKCVVRKNAASLSSSDKIDRIVTNRLLGLSCGFTFFLFSRLQFFGFQSQQTSHADSDDL